MDWSTTANVLGVLAFIAVFGRNIAARLRRFIRPGLTLSTLEVHPQGGLKAMLVASQDLPPDTLLFHFRADFRSAHSPPEIRAMHEMGDGPLPNDRWFRAVFIPQDSEDSHRVASTPSPFHSVRLRLNRTWKTEDDPFPHGVFSNDELERLIAHSIVVWGASVSVRVQTSGGDIHLSGQDTLTPPIAKEEFQFWPRLRRSLALR